MKKVLVIEDHPDMLDVLTRQLERLGVAVIKAKSGIEGVKKAIEEKPNLILMDIMMPDMDGIEAIRMIRQNPAMTTIRIVGVTALSRTLDLEKCLEAGCNGLLLKPFFYKDLERKVREFLPD